MEMLQLIYASHPLLSLKTVRELPCAYLVSRKFTFPTDTTHLMAGWLAGWREQRKVNGPLSCSLTGCSPNEPPSEINPSNLRNALSIHSGSSAESRKFCTHIIILVAIAVQQTAVRWHVDLIVYKKNAFFNRLASILEHYESQLYRFAFQGNVLRNLVAI